MPPVQRVRPILLGAGLLLALVACAPAEPEATATPELSHTATNTLTPSPTLTATTTLTPTPSLTPTTTLTPAPSDTPTPEALSALSIANANCRWGPGTAYIDYGVFHEGDSAVVEARDFTNSWIYIQPPNLDRHCWVIVSAVELSGEITEVGTAPPNIPTNSEVPSPSGITAVRNGGQVTISWNHIPDAPERGYLLEVVLCVNGFRINQAFAAEGTSITLNDGTDCSGPSSGTIRGRNKLGYSSAVTIPWP